MIDLHCHILPGLDDGPKTFDESVGMCRIAAADGITSIIATPHFRPGTWEHPSQRIDREVTALNAVLRKQDIPVTVLPGAEVSITPELDRQVRAHGGLTLNRSGKYLLAEFPTDHVPPRWDTFLLSLVPGGLMPILAHPERNLWFMNHRSAVYAFVRSGGMLQVTAMSITGLFGEEVQEFCMFLLKHDLVQVIASDAHAASGRVPVLSRAVDVAAGVLGREKALALVTSIPAAIIEGREVVIPRPVMQQAAPKRKTWLQRLVEL